jgi:hypothetical protein
LRLVVGRFKNLASIFVMILGPVAPALSFAVTFDKLAAKREPGIKDMMFEKWLYERTYLVEVLSKVTDLIRITCPVLTFGNFNFETIVYQESPEASVNLISLVKSSNMIC